MHPKLMELSLLEDNWDSYGGSAITKIALEKANLLLRALQAIQAVEPWIIPCGGGGIQLEWHRNGFDIEIEISPEGEVTELFYNEKTNA